MTQHSAMVDGPRISSVRRRGESALIPVLLAGLVGVLLWSVTSGRYPVPLDHVLAILVSRFVDVTPIWTSTELVVVEVVRLPRVLMAAMAGAGLALSGAVLQGLFRNPLVGPQTIGAASGAALGGVVAILFLGFGLGVQVGAFVGAALALIAVLAIHRSDGLSPILSLVLAGVVVSAFCAALVGLVTYVADPETKLPGIVFWLLGSFAAASWTKLGLISVCTVLAGIVMLGMRWRINVLSLGDEDARSLGVNPARDRLILITATCLAISAQVAVSGTIGWVGLVIPNLARMIVGADHRRLLPVATLMGAIFLVVADTLSRDLTAAEIPVGIVTAIVGTPIFAYLLRRNAASKAP
ncbi:MULTISPECIES: iron ABC transporter permease [unclassified Beijerinckia]|uniref:FecCD family ABC transporter permease n=1 Tax=unclassified Beijerinckia TaxID=2638183 RepID=UPI00089BC7D5|nr:MULTISPECIES: iron ABC transporter permease [unclassified Beijerinckia]MDH7794590.1 iron complex transport system permease protein [Beijerinckia sp. GAS462]SEB67713.1 iron complex transport system permease protein [Beijerinckia sp. 28-YEA-48]